MKEFIWKKFGKVKEMYENCEGFFKKNENLYGKMLNSTEKCKNLNGKNMEKWRICMETWRIYKEKWRISMEKWRIRLDKRKNLYGPTVF